ncbi:hypothetical protein Ahos_1724 [Acidianus hospitalis W1]|uniref:Uncharacterized protein n=1 Tax=Acidianus hospitalis (strain W1) TaxID=933801 RepID=F4B6I1_ACIHW|nr:hypothetical protein Ahos_1724 [Acidianus hospitalis W1]
MKKSDLFLVSYSFSSIGGPLALVAQFSRGLSPLDVILSSILFLPTVYVTKKIKGDKGLYEYLLNRVKFLRLSSISDSFPLFKLYCGLRCLLYFTT